VRWVIAATLLLLAGTCGALALLPRAAGHYDELREARDRWASSAPAAYRLLLDAGARCALGVEVRGERAVRLQPRDACVPPARTVPELFSLIDTLNTWTEPCLTSRCVCRTVMGSTARFDSRLGYPRSISVWTRDEPNIWSGDYWHYLATHIGQPLPCTASIEGLVVRVVSLDPVK
jgi:hypothetical protein